MRRADASSTAIPPENRIHPEESNSIKSRIDAWCHTVKFSNNRITVKQSLKKFTFLEPVFGEDQCPADGFWLSIRKDSANTDYENGWSGRSS